MPLLATLALTLLLIPAAAFSTLEDGGDCRTALRRFSRHLMPYARTVLERMEARWDRNQQVMSFLTGRLLGSEVTRQPDMQVDTLVEVEEDEDVDALFKTIHLFLAEGIQYELRDTYFGLHSCRSKRAALRGCVPGKEIVLGLYPHPDWQSKAARWLSTSRFKEVPRAILSTAMFPIGSALQEQTTDIFYGDRAVGSGGISLIPDGDRYQITLYGALLNQTFFPNVLPLLKRMFRHTAVQSITLQIPPFLTSLSEGLPQLMRGQLEGTLLATMDPAGRAAALQEIAAQTAMGFGVTAAADGEGFVVPIDQQRTIVLRYLPD